MFMSLELDRANIQQAVTDNFLKELHMNTNGTQAQLYPSFQKANLRVTNAKYRLQPRKHGVQAIFPLRRITISTCLEVDRSRPLDPSSDGPLVHCRIMSVLVKWTKELFGMSFAVRHPSRRVHPGCKSTITTTGYALTQIR